MKESSNFTPRYQGCSGIFNAGEDLTSRENEEIHYRKHVVFGNEWGQKFPVGEYRGRAKNHLDNLDADDIIEFCQAEDLAVVKYNINTGELGLARRDDGKIKTFFRPNDIHYILRKLDQGLWGEPDILFGYENRNLEQADFTDDPIKSYLFDRLHTLSSELSSQAHLVTLNFIENCPQENEIMLLLSRICECQFLAFELERRILSEEQEDYVHLLKKETTNSEATLEALERCKENDLIQIIESGIKQLILNHKELWIDANNFIQELEDFDLALEERDKLGFVLMMIRILQIHERFLKFDLLPFEYLLRKSDLYFRKFLYPLAKRLNFKQEKYMIFPENFFWRNLQGI